MQSENCVFILRTGKNKDKHDAPAEVIDKQSIRPDRGEQCPSGQIHDRASTEDGGDKQTEEAAGFSAETDEGYHVPSQPVQSLQGEHRGCHR